MEHDSSSRSGYHEPKPGNAGRLGDEAWHEDRDLSQVSSINLIWAQARAKDGTAGAIGFEGGIPWHLSEDLKRFRELTISHPVIMGRRTWESMGSRPLQGRDNIVLSQDPDFQASGATVAMNLESAIDLAHQEAIPDDGISRKEIWIIGGSRVFAEALAEADKAYVTDIDSVVDADTFAPDLAGLVAHKLWRLASAGKWQSPSNKADRGVDRYRYLTYEKVN